MVLLLARLRLVRVGISPGWGDDWVMGSLRIMQLILRQEGVWDGELFRLLLLDDHSAIELPRLRLLLPILVVVC